MKIAFSTLGCPGWSWSETVVSAKDLGYDGIELRGLEQQMYLPKATLLTGNHLQATKEHLNKMNLQIPCLASTCYLHDSDFEAKDCLPSFHNRNSKVPKRDNGINLKRGSVLVKADRKCLLLVLS